MKAKFCWTCGSEKDPRDFPHDSAQYDGLAAECARCAECREIARRLDGIDGPRTTPIEGEGRSKAPRNITASAREHHLAAGLRRRPASGLMPTEV